MTGFWKQFIEAWSLAMIPLGAMFALAAFPATDILARTFYEIVDWPSTRPVVFEPADYRLSVALVGALTMGWTFLMAGMVRIGHKVGAPVWRLLAWGLAVWWVVDSGASILLGFPMNAVSNTVVIAGYLIPMLATGVLKSGSAPPFLASEAPLR